MSQLESRLNSGAESIWGRFCKTISEVDLRMAAIVPAAIGVITFVAGVGQLEAEQSRKASMYLGGSVALSGLGSTPGFYVDGRQAGLDGEEATATMRPR
ncbi:hypothetical protein RYY46_006543 [Pseudomonas aeruginosa]|nr:hypothetical protein [Pseudomonas aeruginosa]